MCETENSLSEENNHKIELSDVYATLSGKFVHAQKSDWIVLRIFLSAGAILFLIGVLLFIPSFDVNVGYAVMCLLIGAVFVTVPVCVMVWWKRGNSKVATYLQDAVPIQAHAYKVDEQIDTNTFSKRIRIRVHFQFGAKKYKILSPITWEGLFDIRYKRYADKNITIWYSPYYNEVMLLKKSDNSK